MMASFYAVSYFLIDLIGGGVLIDPQATRSTSRTTSSGGHHSQSLVVAL